MSVREERIGEWVTYGVLGYRVEMTWGTWTGRMGTKCEAQ